MEVPPNISTCEVLFGDHGGPVPVWSLLKSKHLIKKHKKKKGALVFELF